MTKIERMSTLSIISQLSYRDAYWRNVDALLVRYMYRAAVGLRGVISDELPCEYIEWSEA